MNMSKLWQIGILSLTFLALALCVVGQNAVTPPKVAVKNPVPQTPCAMKSLKPANPIRLKKVPLRKPSLSNVPVEMTAEMLENIAKLMDEDCDGVSDYYDNCFGFPSKNLKDSDGDGFGDVCDKISSDLAVRMTASRKLVRIGGKIQFSIVITNHGPTEIADGIQIIDIFPLVLKANSVTTTNGECDESEGGMLCDAGPLQIGESMTITISTTAVRSRTVLNRVSVENGIGDLNRKNNNAAIWIKIVR